MNLSYVIISLYLKAYNDCFFMNPHSNTFSF